MNQAAGLLAAASDTICARSGFNSASIASVISRNVARGCAARHARTFPTTASICCAHRASSTSQSDFPIVVLPHASGYLTQYPVGHPSGCDSLL